METAFPFKILSYLTHNLRVMSTRINSIQKSQLCSLIDFAANDSPEAIAHAIQSIDLTEEFNSRSVTRQLDEILLRKSTTPDLVGGLNSLVLRTLISISQG